MSRANANQTDTEPAARAVHDAGPLAAILEACADGERGYRAAATDVNDPGCALMFDHYAAERSRFAGALRAAAHADARPAPGSVAGAVHRGWMDARAKLTHGKARALVAECARGEDAALHAYREALRANLSPGLRELVQEQYDAVKAAHAELTAILDAGAA